MSVRKEFTKLLYDAMARNKDIILILGDLGYGHFNQHRIDYPEWGENIENFLVDSNVYGKIKNDNLSIDEYKYVFESNISIIWYL